MLEATGSQSPTGSVSTGPASSIREASDLSVSGAVVQFRRRHFVGPDRERIDDIGIGLVLDGHCPAASVAMELGSHSVVQLDLSQELVVLGWVDLDTLTEVRRLADAAQGSGRVPKDAGPFCFGIALRCLRTLGFSTITRPSLLRIGFRDVLRDLDPDGARTVRVDLGSGRVSRVDLDADANSLRVDVPAPDEVQAAVAAALAEAFPRADLRKSEREDEGCTFEVRLPLPLSLMELRALVEQMRAGLAHLLWKFEPGRSQVVAEQLATFGRRDSLQRLEAAPATPPAPGPLPARPAGASRVVH